MLCVLPQLSEGGTGLSTLRAEYIHRYNWLLDHEKQPHSDFFTNLSIDFPQRTQMIPPEEEVLGMVVEDHGDTEVRGVGLDHLEGM